MLRLQSHWLRVVGRVGVVALAARFTAACYTNIPVSTDARPVGSPVVADITDRGRVSLGASLGPSPLRVEGRLTAASDTALTLAVTRVEGLRGESTTWTGEPVTLRTADVGLLRVRRIDRFRTALVTLAAVGLAALALTVSLVVGGSGSGGGGGGGGPGNES